MASEMSVLFDPTPEAFPFEHLHRVPKFAANVQTPGIATRRPTSRFEAFPARITPCFSKSKRSFVDLAAYTHTPEAMRLHNIRVGREFYLCKFLELQQRAESF
jgi:hypothetical protein